MSIEKTLQNSPSIPGAARRSRLTYRDKYAHVPQKIKDVATGMESQFINHMINEMRKSVEKVEAQGPAQRFYSSKLDENYAEIMAKSDNGLGLKNLIIEQLAPQYVRSHNAFNHSIGQKVYNQEATRPNKGGSHE